MSYCGYIIVAIFIIIYFFGSRHMEQMKYSSDMIKLWTDHMLYTRQAVVAALSTGRDNKANDIIGVRLLKNQSDIGTLFGKRHGAENGQKLTSLLQTHIRNASAALSAVRSNDSVAIAKAKTDLYVNADEIGKFLDDLLNTTQTFTTHMKLHIDTLLANVAAYASGDYPADVDTLDAYVLSTTKMAEELS